MSAEKYEVPKSEEAAQANREKMTATKTAWMKAAEHPGVVLPSGAVITVRIPNLAKLAQSGEIPNELVDIAAAAEQAGDRDMPADALEKLAKLQDFLVAETVVAPKITPDEVSKLPAEDLPFLAEIAYRQRDVDAVGNSIAGLDKLAKYATFREEYDSDEAALDA